MAALTKPTVKINSVTYEAVPSVKIQGITDSTGTYDDLDFYWTGDATISAASQLLTGIKAYGPNGVITGNIPSKSSSDLTADGPTVTAPAGYYASDATKTVATGTAAAVATATAASVSSSTAWLSTTAGGSSYKITVAPNGNVVTPGWITSVTNTSNDYYVQVETKTLTEANSGTVSATAGKLIKDISITSPTASKIAYGQTVYGASGTFTKADTVSSGQLAAASGQILTGYSAWVDGAEVKGSVGTITGDNTTDGITATSTLIKLSVPDTGYYDDTATISANFKGTGSILAAYDTQNSTAYNTDGGNVAVTAKTTNIPNGYYQGKQAIVTQGVGTCDWSLSASASNYVSTSETSSYSFSIDPSVTISTAGWIAQGDITDAAGSVRAVYLIPGQASTSASVSDADYALQGSPEDETPEIIVTPTGSVSRNGWITSTGGEFITGAAQTFNITKGTASINAAATSTYISDSSATAGSSTYKITVNANPSVTAGWVSSIGGTATKDYYVKVQTKSVTLSGSAQTISPDSGKLLSSVSVPAVSLSASNIKTGVTYYGTTGTFTSDATATAGQILSGATAYVNGSKVTGTIANGSVTYTANTSTAVTTSAGYYATSVTTNVPSVTQDSTTKVLTIA